MEKPNFPLPTQAGVSLGSNLGDCNFILNQAINELRKWHIGPPSTFLVSSFYKTPPVDCPPESPDFLNAALQLETSLSPFELLEIFQQMETSAGRVFPRVKNTPRTLDLDLLYHGIISLSTDQLILPHPKILNRAFVLKPLSEIVPDLTLPGWNKTAKKYLLNLEK